MKLFISKQNIVILGDLIIGIIAVYVAAYLRFFDNPLTFNVTPFLMLKAIVFSISMTLMCFFVDLYKDGNGNQKRDVFLKIVIAAVLSSILLAAFYYFVRSLLLWRGIFFMSICLTVIFQSIWHVGYSFILKLPVSVSRVLILGTGRSADTLGTILNSNNNGLALVGYVNCIGEPVHVPTKSIIGNGDSLIATAMKQRVQKVVISLNERRGTLPIREVLDCKLNGIDVVDGTFFYEQITGKLLIESMNPSHIIFSDGFRSTVIGRHIKRVFDVVFAVTGIILALPLFLIVPALIKIDSKGPVFFKQKRIGEGEKLFKLYKFRTMVDGAEKDSGPVWSRVGDKRITKIGKLLRKTRIDELPQLINVINGEMSFIGPRPERQFFVESLKKTIPYYSERHCVKPGITGWAQVKYQYGDSIKDAIEKAKYDLYYIKYQSVLLDLLIMLDTVKVVLFGRGGR